MTTTKTESERRRLKVLFGLWNVDPKQATTIVERALRFHKGNVMGAARGLGIGRRTLWRWINEKPGLLAALHLIRRENS